jgi:NADPH:quinone reductase-like Zn-dependent oxidoreductase
LSLLVGQRLIGLNTTERREDLVALVEMIETGVVTPLVDRTFDLVEAADAIRYLAQGHPRGKVVVTV